MGDCGLDISCNVGNIAQGELERFAKQLIEGANDLWNGFFTSWIGAGLDGIVGGATSDWFMGIAMPIQVALLTLGLIVAGIRIALSARGEVAADAAKKFLRAILISAGGVAFFSVLQVGSNALSKSILEAASAGGTPNFLWEAETFAGNVAMSVTFGLLGMLAVGIQWIIMILRAVAISVLLPFWPVTAAGAMFDSQQAMFEKTTGWLLAFLLYGPVAAALYGLAIRFRQGRDGIEGVMIGMAIFVLAIFALPALMKLVVPITAAVGRASAGGMAFGAVKTAVVTGVAVGSVVATAGASAPAVAGAASGGSAAASGGAAASGSAGAAGASGSGTAGSTGTAGASGSAGSSGRSGWDSARDLGNAMPTGSRGVGEMIDD